MAGRKAQAGAARDWVQIDPSGARFVDPKEVFASEAVKKLIADVATIEVSRPAKLRKAS